MRKVNFIINCKKWFSKKYFCIKKIILINKTFKIYENFDIVENDNVDKVVQYDESSLLGSLQNDEDQVEGVWGCSTLGKEMRLCKG